VAESHHVSDPTELLYKKNPPLFYSLKAIKSMTLSLNKKYQTLIKWNETCFNLRLQPEPAMPQAIFSFPEFVSVPWWKMISYHK